MRGRQLFIKFRGLLHVFSYILKMFPSKMLVAIWDTVSPFSGRMAMAVRYIILKRLAKSCGENIMIGPRVRIIAPQRLTLGNNISIHDGCYIDATGGIDICDEVSIAHQCTVLSSSHTWEDVHLPIRDNPIALKKTVIKTDVWIGCSSRIMAGIEIGSRSIVAAGAVVTKNIGDNSIVAGVPARKIRRI